ncbi:MAG: phosphatase PAP2 family protein [Sphingomicrobium sp.]
MPAPSSVDAAAIRRASSPAVIGGLAAIWLAMLVLGGRGIDHSVLLASHVSEDTWLRILLAVTRFGDWGLLVAASFFGSAWLMYRRQFGPALLLLGSTLAGRLAVSLQKWFLGRVRPESDSPLVDVQSLSFPSGHAANSMIVYLLVALILVPPGRQRDWAAAAAVTASLLIGASRVPLGLHWPSDVIGGWAFGLLWVLLCLALAQRLARD